MRLCSVGIFNRCCFEQKTQRDANVCFNLLSREKRSAQLRYVKRTNKKFLFGARKPLFLGMPQFCFLSVASWEIVNFVFILFLFL